MDLLGGVAAFRRFGVMVVPPSLSDGAFDAVREDYDRCVRDGTSKNQAPYHYGGPPRDFGLWRRSAACRRVAYQQSVVHAIMDIYGADVEPFQTLNFSRGSNQPLHRDEVHFQTKPPDLMIAGWTALEDVAPESGPLVVYPGSQAMEPVNLWDLGLPPAQYGVKDPNYAEYEKHIAALAVGYERVPCLVKKGETVLFHAGVIHGGSPTLDPEVSRYSQVTHYWLPELADVAYAPMLSTPTTPAVKDMATKMFGNKANWEAH